jgi:hypothetical protein
VCSRVGFSFDKLYVNFELSYIIALGGQMCSYYMCLDLKLRVSTLAPKIP